jgi:hypothetical protein
MGIFNKISEKTKKRNITHFLGFSVKEDNICIIYIYKIIIVIDVKNFGG